MTGAPSTIRATRTAPPPAVPALLDAQIQAVNLAYTLRQIRDYGGLEGWPAMELLEALEAVEDAQHRIRDLQMREQP